MAYIRFIRTKQNIADIFESWNNKNTQKKTDIEREMGKMCDQYGRRARFGHANDFGSKILYFLSNCQFKFVFFDPCIKP